MFWFWFTYAVANYSEDMLLLLLLLLFLIIIDRIFKAKNRVAQAQVIFHYFAVGFFRHCQEIQQADTYFFVIFHLEVVTFIKVYICIYQWHSQRS